MEEVICEIIYGLLMDVMHNRQPVVLASGEFIMYYLLGDIIRCWSSMEVIFGVQVEITDMISELKEH